MLYLNRSHPFTGRGNNDEYYVIRNASPKLRNYHIRINNFVLNQFVGIVVNVIPHDELIEREDA